MSSLRERKIIHIDMDAFFAAVEVRDDPALKGKPVIVGGLHSNSRGVVSTCTYEARAYGVHSAMPLARAYALCPGAVFLPVRMEKYAQASAQVMDILASYTDLVEQVSLDEAYLDVTGTQRIFGTALAIARTIKTRIEEELHLPVSVGVSTNKLMAKIAAQLAKPGGIRRIKKDEIDAALDTVPLNAIPGIGPSTEKELKARGVETVAQLKNFPQESLVAIFGTVGLILSQSAHGIDYSPVVSSHEIKSMSREETFQRDVRNYAVLRQALVELLQEVIDDLRQNRLRSKTVAIKLRFSDFYTITRSKTLEDDIGDVDDALLVAEKLLRENLHERPVRLLGVCLSHLISGDSPVQLSLFSDNRKYHLTDSVYEIKRKFGHGAIQKAVLLKDRALQKEKTYGRGPSAQRYS